MWQKLKYSENNYTSFSLPSLDQSHSCRRGKKEAKFWIQKSHCVVFGCVDSEWKGKWRTTFVFGWDRARREKNGDGPCIETRGAKSYLWCVLRKRGRKWAKSYVSMYGVCESEGQFSTHFRPILDRKLFDRMGNYFLSHFLLISSPPFFFLSK